MASILKCLLGLVLVPSTLWKTRLCCKPSAGEAVTRGPWGLLLSQSRQVFELQVQWETVRVSGWRSDWGMTHDDFCPPRVHTLEVSLAVSMAHASWTVVWIVKYHPGKSSSPKLMINYHLQKSKQNVRDKNLYISSRFCKTVRSLREQALDRCFNSHRKLDSGLTVEPIKVRSRVYFGSEAVYFKCDFMYIY